MTEDGPGSHAQADLVEAFAREASRSGWTRATLRRFCADRGIGEAETAERWPDGVRGLGRAFNDDADARMKGALEGLPGLTLTGILMARFAQNADRKGAVARLAWSDLFHPLDTLGRTARTARLMLAMRSEKQGGSATSRLVLAYCLAVLVWLGDRTVDQRLTRRAVRLGLLLVGLR
ncbi:MAG: hypothetical protein Q7U20_08695 [Caulobacter sp.]|nr:hypothetical protein [Caulobacter sp.]